MKSMMILVLMVVITFPWASSNKVLDLIDKTINPLIDDSGPCQGTFGQCSLETCTKITCPANLSGDAITVAMTIQRCNKPVSITTLIKSNVSPNLNWTNTFSASSIVSVPGFSYQHESIMYGAFLNVTFELETTILRLQISLQYGSERKVLKSDNIIGYEVPLSTRGCWFTVWWRSQSELVRMLVIVAMVSVSGLLLLGISCCFVCCLCRCQKKHAKRKRF